jgi:serine/threonine protein kinase
VRGQTATTLEPGVRLGRFTVTRFLGAGGMGAVYAAQDPELDRTVA